jgi:hypothetical protein
MPQICGMVPTALLPFRRKACLRIFPLLKIRRLRPGLNPRTWVPDASTLTPRPPKPLGGHVNGASVSVNHGQSSSVYNVRSKHCAQKSKCAYVPSSESPISEPKIKSHLQQCWKRCHVRDIIKKSTVQADNLNVIAVAAYTSPCKIS